LFSIRQQDVNIIYDLVPSSPVLLALCVACSLHRLAMQIKWDLMLINPLRLPVILCCCLYFVIVGSMKVTYSLSQRCHVFYYGVRKGKPRTSGKK
jgi:hypothetical protein